MIGLVGALLSVMLTQVGADPSSMQLGEVFRIANADCVALLTFEKDESQSDSFWDYYTLTIEIENRSSDIIKFDGSKVYLVDAHGLSVFRDTVDKEVLTDELGDLHLETLLLLGRTLEAEAIQARRATENQAQEKLDEIPPGAREKLSEGFHTPVRSDHFLLSLLGFSLGGEQIKLEPIKIVLGEQG